MGANFSFCFTTSRFLIFLGPLGVYCSFHAVIALLALFYNKTPLWAFFRNDNFFQNDNFPRRSLLMLFVFPKRLLGERFFETTTFPQTTIFICLHYLFFFFKKTPLWTFNRNDFAPNDNFQ